MKTRTSIRKWALRLLMMIALAVIALQLAKKFETSAQDVAAQRSELANRVPTQAVSDVDAASLLDNAWPPFDKIVSLVPELVILPRFIQEKNQQTNSAQRLTLQAFV